jgi:DNA-binding transcriptional ArsR family regulator
LAKPGRAVAIPTTKRSALVFAALGDETRLNLIARLHSEPMSIATLTEGTKVTRQGITKHLHVMETAGLVRNTRHGRESRWRLEPKPIDDARHYLDLISGQWDEALGRLRKFVES